MDLKTSLELKSLRLHETGVRVFARWLYSGASLPLVCLYKVAARSNANSARLVFTKLEIATGVEDV